MSVLEPTPVANQRIWALPLVANSGYSSPAIHNYILSARRPVVREELRNATTDNVPFPWSMV